MCKEIYYYIILNRLISLSPNSSSGVFVALFIISFVGSFLVTMNGILLNAKLKYFQTICIMGYCMFPIVLAAAILCIFNKVGYSHRLVNVIIACVAFVWSSFGKFKSIIIISVYCIFYSNY